MRKKLFILCILALVVGVCFAASNLVAPMDKDGTRIDPGAVHTARPTWEVVATSASAGSEPLDIGVTARGPNGKCTYQLVKALQIAGLNGDEKIAIYDLPRGVNAPRIRAMGITDDGDYVARVYFGTLGDGKRDADYTSSSTFDCELAYFGELSFVVGAQSSITAVYEMADTLVVDQTGSTWPDIESRNLSSPATNRVAELRFDAIGADLMVIVPTVIDADSKVITRGY